MLNNAWKKFIHVSKTNWIIRTIVAILIIILFTISLIRFLSIPKVESQNLNIRKNPSPYAKVIGNVEHGQSLHVIKKNKNTGWWKIKINNQKGWVASWLINKEKYNAKNSDNIAETTIVLDPGHGGSDAGTLSAEGNKMEKVYTLKTALKVYHELQNLNANVLLTRDSDKYVPLANRAYLSYASKANLFISFHFNSSNGMYNANGYQVFKYHKNADTFANIIDKKFENLPMENRKVDFGNYYVLRNNTQPAVLLEMGFMDNTHDFKLIKSDAYQQKIASDVRMAVQEYFKD
ncbi:N-acetylmuramoyl-L-alanine amidase [Apilactobacillus xinyiensis]|uniref:N-acetylmuramoyl-L-alanine amidase n=1 Tax=Apilactobacillus xinyiensis TaxID=2841032 RepID=UPI00200DA3AF|nr:N-acetylmuramoyl-L-alanine amidase [Apilactobacillus xinyiensis]MCL0318525.1 N-acetylmuramoyl-L-alanine amidase [Apilactobacillus xinyiensis]